MFIAYICCTHTHTHTQRETHTQMETYAYDMQTKESSQNGNGNEIDERAQAAREVGRGSNRQKLPTAKMYCRGERGEQEQSRRFKATGSGATTVTGE